MSTVHIAQAHSERGRDHSSQRTANSNSTPSPSAKYTPESDSESDSDFGGSLYHAESEETFRLKRSRWREAAEPEPLLSSGRTYGNSLNEVEKQLENPHERSSQSAVPRRSAFWTSDEERVVVKKFDRRLVLFLALLYLLSFLDRSNIGNVSHAVKIIPPTRYLTVRLRQE